MNLYLFDANWQPKILEYSYFAAQPSCHHHKPPRVRLLGASAATAGRSPGLRGSRRRGDGFREMRRHGSVLRRAVDRRGRERPAGLVQARHRLLRVALPRERRQRAGAPAAGKRVLVERRRRRPLRVGGREGRLLGGRRHLG